jgi:hypothetical protein
MFGILTINLKFMSFYNKFIEESKQYSTQIEFNFEKICFLENSLIQKLEKNKLLKEDRTLLIEAIFILSVLRKI